MDMWMEEQMDRQAASSWRLVASHRGEKERLTGPWWASLLQNTHTHTHTLTHSHHTNRDRDI